LEPQVKVCVASLPRSPIVSEEAFGWPDFVLFCAGPQTKATIGTLVTEDVVSVTESSAVALDDSTESDGVLDVEFVVTADLPSSAYPKVISMAITAGARVENFIVRIAASVGSSMNLG
jgi:hypothetical protein